MKIKDQLRFNVARCNKAVTGHRTPKVILLSAIFVLASASCKRTTTPAPQSAQSTPSPTASTSAFPKQIGLVNDFANAFDPSQEKKLDSALTQLRSDADVEFVVVTIESTSGQPLFDYSLNLARNWAPGGDSGRGLVLVLAIKDREWRLQVSRSLEKDLPDDVCLSLAEPAEELYRQGKYAEGVQAYVTAIDNRLKGKQ